MAGTGQQGDAINIAPDTSQKHHRFDIPGRTREGDRKPWEFQELLDHLNTWGDIRLPVQDGANENGTVVGDDEDPEDVHADEDDGDGGVPVEVRSLSLLLRCQY